MHIRIGALYISIGQENAPLWTDSLAGRISKEIQAMSNRLDETLALAREQRTQTGSLIALLTSMKSQLDAALSGENLPAAVQAKINEIFSVIEGEKTEVANALNANTPADGTPVDVPPVEEPKADA